MKKLLILGGDHFTIPVVDAAKAQGYYTITCDYLPNNVAHKHSDEYVNFSTTDKDGVLSWARNNKIDGIVTFTDSGVITCAYVAHHLGLPMTGPLESVEILQNKDKFRIFLAENGFNVPWAYGYSNLEDALNDTAKFSYPLIVKPTDSAGSKGVTRVNNENELKSALEYAFKYSIKGKIIVEEFIEKKGCSSDTDSFSYNGELKFVSFSAQRFDDKAINPYTPAAYSWPATFTDEECLYLKSELQRLLTLLNMNTSIYNIETRIGTNGKPYIMEVSPRGGGNRLAEVLRYATGVDMITACTRAAVGDTIENIEQKPYNGHWAEIILHADNSGIYDRIEISDTLNAEIIEEDLWVKSGDSVEGFEGANKAIGTLILKFNSKEELEKAIINQSEWLKVIVR